jgi:hypothetical protein
MLVFTPLNLIKLIQIILNIFYFSYYINYQLSIHPNLKKINFLNKFKIEWK